MGDIGLFLDHTHGKIDSNGSVRNKVLEKGTVHEDVKIIKSQLNRLGFGEIKISHKFDLITEKRIKDFQRTYDLKVNGKADVQTQRKLTELLNCRFQLDYVHKDVIFLKLKLSWIGFGGMQITEKYGQITENRVKKFQKAFRLPVNGIADPLTCGKIDKLLSQIYKPESKHPQIIELKHRLNKIGFKGIEISSKFGSFTEKRVKEFQEFCGLEITGQANFATLCKINEIINNPLQVGKRSKEVINLKQKLTSLGYGKVKYTNKFGKATEKLVKKFQRENNLPVSGIADQITLDKMKRAMQRKEHIVYNKYNLPLDEAMNIQLKYNKRSSVKEEEVERYLNPNKLIKDEKMRLLFLNLAKANSVNEETLNKFLENKGMLKEKGSDFIDAANHYRISEVYLVIKSLMETNEGKSDLALGIPVDRNGNITYMTSIEEGKKPSVTSQTEKIVFNMYRIYDGDDSGLNNIAKKAFKEDWVTPEKAIFRGAKFVKEKDLEHNEDTFYKMLWHPEYMVNKREVKKFLTPNIEAVLEQINILYQFYKQSSTYRLYLDIPVYK